MQQCPFCAELIQDAAIYCRHCNRDVAKKSLHNDVGSGASTLFQQHREHGSDLPRKLTVILCGVLALGILVTLARSAARSPQVSVGLSNSPDGGATSSTGKIVINPRYDGAKEFSGGLAPVKLGHARKARWGYIDKRGQMVVEPQFSEADPFRDGLARVRIEHGGKMGFIDTRGHFVVPPDFVFVHSFREGLAVAVIGSILFGKWGFIDRTGKFVINPEFDHAYSFSEGLAAVNVGGLKTGMFGFIDKRGRFVIKPRFSWVSMAGFVGGVAYVSQGAWDSPDYVNIDKRGLVVSNTASEPAAGLLSWRDQRTGKWGFVRAGKAVIDPRFDAVTDFKEGLAAVRTGGEETGTWGYINSNGDYVIKPQFASAEAFSDGLAVVRIGDAEAGKWGYISR